MKIICCIFAYKCPIQIERTLTRLASQSFLQKIDHFVIFDNNSPDDTVLKAQKTIESLNSKSRFVIIKNKTNWGLGGSHKAAITYSREQKADWLLLLHGDDQANPKDLASALQLIEADSTKVAYLGSRFMKGSKLHGYSLKREWANRGLNAVYSLVLGRQIHELGAGLSAHQVAFFSDEKYLKFTDGFNFYCYMLIDYIKQRAPIHFFPISWFETDQRSNVANFHIGWITLKLVFHSFDKKLKAHTPKSYDGIVVYDSHTQNR